MLEHIIRLVIAIVFAALSTVLLELSFFTLKKSTMFKNNLKAGVCFGVVLFIFSYFTNWVLSIVTAVLALLIVKYLYVRSWKETLKVWGVWMAYWILLLLLLAGAIAILQPFSSVV